MENRDFDNLFKNQLEGLPEKEFLFEESSWDSVENVLEAKGILLPVKKKWSGFLPFFLLGMLLLSNLLVGWKYYNAEQEITVLNTTIQTLISSVTNINPEVGNNNLSNDDDLNKTTNNVFDKESEIKVVEKIVYKTVKEIVYIPVNSSILSDNTNTTSTSNNNTTGLNNDNSSNNPSKSIPNADNSGNSDSLQANGLVNNNSLKNSSSINTSTPNTNKQINDNALSEQTKSTISSNDQKNKSISQKNTYIAITKKIADNKPLSTLDLIALTELNNPIQQINQPLENIIDTSAYENKLKFKDYLTRIASATKISNYGLGLSSGIDASYQTTNFQPISTRIGITSELTFSEYLKIGTTIDWKETKGELDNIATNNYPDDYFDIYPSMSGINPDDKLNKIEAQDRAVEFSLFAKYMIQPHKNWSPYFGIGIKGEYDYQQRFEYKYLNDQGYEYEMDYVYANNKQLGFNSLSGLVGAQYKLSSNINVRLDGMYNYDYKAHRFDNSQMSWFSTNVGILYKFK